MKNENINKIVNELKKIKEVKAVYLFGSCARGTEKPISDIDICVITEKNILEEKKMEIVSYSGRKIQISIFWSLPIMIRYNVLKQGKPLFERDEKFLHSIKVETLNEYLDFKPVIERFTRLYLGV
ncbi:MAG: nucleotidyltransferase domain-containing protein [Candidatus Aenigmatarchaeota archaeon]